MSQLLSPKDLADAIGISESSLKRWVDEDRLRAERTMGGHRRITLHEALRFIRTTHQRVHRPDMLGLAEIDVQLLDLVSSGRGENALLEALQEGDSARSRGLIFAHYLAARPFAGVCDGPITHAMHRIGELWRHGGDGIMVEHRATQIVLEVLREIHATLPPGRADSPVAVGASVAGDPYQIPTLMAAITLREAGFRDVNLGADLPISALIEAMTRHKPRLVWLSASVLTEAESFQTDLARLAQAVEQSGAALAVGGRQVIAAEVGAMPATHVISSMSELYALSRGMIETEERAGTMPRGGA